MLFHYHIPTFYNLLMVEMTDMCVTVLAFAKCFSELSYHNGFDHLKPAFMPVCKEKRRFAVLHHLVNIRRCIDEHTRFIVVQRAEHLSQPNHTLFVVVPLHDKQANIFMFNQSHINNTADHTNHVAYKFLVARVRVKNMTARRCNGIKTIEVRKVT